MSIRDRHTSFALCLLFILPAAMAQVAVTTYHDDNARTGQNVQEQILTPSNVNASSFGMLKQYSIQPCASPCDSHGYAYAEPLFAPNVSIAGSLHNIVYVATEGNQIFAFDADLNQSTPLWTKTYDVPFIPGSGPSNYLADTIGIQSTPVIDSSSGTMYFVSNTQSGGTFLQKLHAVDITNGAEKFGGPVTIQGSVPGNGEGGSTVKFNAATQNQRPALLLQNGTVYIAWGSYDDDTSLGMYHGWVMAYNAATLAQKAVFNTTPNGHEGSTWALGALAADAAGDIYVGSANGDPNQASNDSNPSNSNFANGYLKLSGSTLGILDYFMPSQWSMFTTDDQDANGGGAIVLPDQPGSIPHLLVWGTKDGHIYVANRDNMGMLMSSDSGLVQSIQEWNASSCAGDDGSCVRTLPAYWNGNVYFIVQNHGLQAFSLTNGTLSTSPTSQDTTTLYPLRGATPSVSANGSSNGIVWSVKTDPDTSGTGAGKPSTLYAYDATNAASILYSSNQNASRDALTPAQNFTVPLVANGKVYIATRDNLVVYGLLAYTSAKPPVAQLSVNPAGALTVTASTAGSSDPNSGGSIVSSWIDFGDGTRVNATSATHTYGSSGTYTVTGTVYGASGRFAQTATSVNTSSGEPSAVSVTPNSGTGSSQTFTFQYSDSSGYTSLDTVYAYIGNGGQANSCYVYYQVSNNTLVLLNDAATGSSAAHPGTATTLQNSQCSINVANSAASGSGTTLSLQLAITFSSSYAGSQGLWLQANDTAGATTNWNRLGSWTVASSQQVPTVVSVTPSSGSGPSQSFAFQYADSGGYTSLDTVYAYIGNGGQANSCYVYYQVSNNTLVLLNDAATGSSSAHPGTATTLQNSQCSINVANSAASGSGTTLSLQLAVSFSSSYAGSQGLWLQANGTTGSTTNWNRLGTWTVASSGGT